MTSMTVKPGFWAKAGVSIGTSALFMALYHTCNFYAAGCGRLRYWYASWELAIPVVPWFIVPYWSIDIFFAIAPFLCTHRSELRALAGRLTLAILLASACFVVWPLGLMHVRSDEQGLFTPLFAAIHAFDKPHNLFPSLHVAFAFILRWTYHRHVRGLPRLLFHGWFLCISLSTILVHQHHLVDLVGGLALAILCCYLVTEDACPTARVEVDRHGAGLAVLLLAGATTCLVAAWWLADWWWVLAWPAAALAIAGAAYLGLGASVFGKRADGLPWSARVVLGPWLLPQIWSRWWWWRRDAQGAAEVADGVWFGRLPDPALLRRHGFRGVLDLTAEHDGPPAATGLTVERLPMLDLAMPNSASLTTAIEAVERLRACGPVLIHCALGYGRSATVAAAWLLATGRETTPEAAAARVAVVRPGANIPSDVLMRLPTTWPTTT